MTKIVEYKNKKGQKLYKFQAYLGIDEQTGKKKVTRRGGFKSKREAELVLSRLQSSFEDHGAPQHNNILFKDVYEEWYESYINTVRVSTYARTRAMFNNHILPAFGEKRICTITIRDVQKAVNLWFEIAPVSGINVGISTPRTSLILRLGWATFTIQILLRQLCSPAAKNYQGMRQRTFMTEKN